MRRTARGSSTTRSSVHRTYLRSCSVVLVVRDLSSHTPATGPRISSANATRTGVTALACTKLPWCSSDIGKYAPVNAHIVPMGATRVTPVVRPSEGRPASHGPTISRMTDDRPLISGCSDPEPPTSRPPWLRHMRRPQIPRPPQCHDRLDPLRLSSPCSSRNARQDLPNATHRTQWPDNHSATCFRTVSAEGRWMARNGRQPQIRNT